MDNGENFENARYATNNDTTGFIDQIKNRNTSRKTEYDLKLMKNYFATIGEIRNVEDIQPVELDLCLARFFLNVRKTDKTEYEPDTLKSYQSSLSRYLQEKNYEKNILLDPTFRHSRDVLNAKRKELKSQGKGNKPNKAEALTSQDISILYEKGQLGNGTPHALINTVWWNNTTHFGLRSRQEHIDMRWGGDVQLMQTSAGEEYLQYTERMTKTRNGVSGETRPFPPKMFEKKGNNRCPVQTYKEYASRRPEDLNEDPDSAFYLSIIPKCNSNSKAWYSRQNMGKNTIGNNMNKMCQNAGIEGRKVNHSARRTTVSALLHDGVAPTTIMQITGHRNVHSINHYGSASLNQQRDISKTLSSLHNEGSVSTNDFNDNEDESLLRASQEVEDALQNISNYETLLTNFDLDIPNDPEVIQIPTTSCSNVSSCQNVMVTVPSNAPSLIDIPLPEHMRTSSMGYSNNNWFSGANIGSGVTININTAPQRQRKRVRVIESDSDEN